MIKNRLLASLLAISFAVASSYCKSDSANNQAIVKATPLANDKTEQVNYMESNRLPGEYLRAFLVAHQAFLADEGIPPQKRKVENYWVEFSQEAKSYEVLFIAKRKPNERELDGGESELGKDVRFSISKDDYRVLSRRFFK